MSRTVRAVSPEAAERGPGWAWRWSRAGVPGTGKVCVSIPNDGDLLYTPGSLWDAAHHEIPMPVVMFNNRPYFQDVGHQRAITTMRGRSLDTGHRLCDARQELRPLREGPIVDPDDIRPALERGVKLVKAGKLALVDTVTQPR